MATCLAGARLVTTWSGTNVMFRSANLSRMALDADGDAGTGVPHGDTTLIWVLDRTPRTASHSSNSMAPSQGAGGHLKGSPRTPIITAPHLNDGSTSRSLRAPAME